MSKNMNSDKSTGNLGCYDMAKAIKELMTMANFSGFIKQEDGEPFRQFSVSAIEGSREKASIRFNISGCGFVLDISPDPDTHVSVE